MSTVKLVDENTNNPKVRAIFEDIKATKRLTAFPTSGERWRRIRNTWNFAGLGSRPLCNPARSIC